MAKRKTAADADERVTVKLTAALVKCLDLKPTDILVFTMPYEINGEQAGIVNAKLRELLTSYKIDNRLVVLAPGMTMNVVRTEP